MKSALVRMRRRDAIGLLAAAAMLPLLSLPWTARTAWSDVATADAEAVVNELAAQIWQSLGRTELSEQGRIDAIAALLSDATDVDAAEPPGARPATGSSSTTSRRRATRPCSATSSCASFASRLNQYAKDAQGPLEDHFTIISSAPAGKQDVLVRSQGAAAVGRARWRSTGGCAQGDGGPVIIDLIIEGVSLLVSQRSEFAAVIERSDMEGLLAELQARASSTKS